jgi:UDP-N-acetylmuramoyl-tripeptide--D-alanyl-D-alanine ligase
MARGAGALMEPTPLRELLDGITHQMIGTAPIAVTGVCTDTRSLQSGDLFFALTGERSNGHEYVGRALELGATAAVVADAGACSGSGPLIVVDDTLRALGLAARNYRRRFRTPVVAITGSVGKTSVKEMTAAAIRAERNVLASRKNFNNEIGVPLTLFELSGEHEAAVIEMGMRGAGEIDWLAEIAEPTIGVITNIGHSHLERLGSREGIAEAKAELLARLPANGIAILPRYDDYFDLLKSRVPPACRIITFSDDPGGKPDVLVVADQASNSYFFSAAARKRAAIAATGCAHRFTIPGPVAAHVARNAAAAVAVAFALEIPVQPAADALKQFAPIEGRWRSLAGMHGATVIDDCYNAAPESMAAALAMFARAADADRDGRSADASVARESEPAGRDGKGRRVAVIGEMRELGESGPALHRAIAKQLAGIDLLVTVGGLAREIAVEVERLTADGGGRPPTHRHFPDSDEAAGRIWDAVRPGDTVLVKGSRALEMEKIVAALTGGLGAVAHE